MKLKALMTASALFLVLCGDAYAGDSDSGDPVVLQGQHCLVFFMGGVQTSATQGARTKGASSGFSSGWDHDVIRRTSLPGSMPTVSNPGRQVRNIHLSAKVLSTASARR